MPIKDMSHGMFNMECVKIADIDGKLVVGLAKYHL